MLVCESAELWIFKSYVGGGVGWSDLEILKMRISTIPSPQGFTISKCGFSKSLVKTVDESRGIWLPNMTKRVCIKNGISGSCSNNSAFVV